MKMSKKFSRRFEVIDDWASIISGAFLYFLHYFKIVPGFGSTAALAATVFIAYFGPIGLIMVVVGVADLLKDRFFIAGPEDDDYYDEESEEDDYCEEEDYYEEDDDTRDF